MVATLKIVEKLKQKNYQSDVFLKFSKQFSYNFERKRPKYARISGIGNETGRFYLGFQENFESCDQDDLGFQESGQEAGAAGTDCRNLHFHRPRRSPFFSNPAPLMQNYMIKSVKMTKKSILRDQFSWKVRTFAHVFSQRHYFILLNYPVELRPRTRFSEQIQIHIEAAHHSADFYHSVFGAVAGLTGYVGRGLRFLYAFELVLSPQI